MPTSLAKHKSFTLIESLRARCMAVGLPTWRVSSAGMVTDTPDMPGVAGNLLRTRSITGLVLAAATRWCARRPDTDTEPAEHIIEAFPGCWVVPLPDHRLRHSSATFALALGPAAFEGGVFESACCELALDLSNARSGLRDLATHSAQSAAQARELLAMMHSDLLSLSEQEETLTGLTTQLTDSYETIDALYSIGRSMSDLNQPERFVDTVCSRLKATLSFEFIGARFSSDSKLVLGLRDRSITVGSPQVLAENLRQTADRVMARLPIERKCVILDDAPGLVWERYPQAIAQPLLRDDKVVGVLFAGRKLGPDPMVSSYDTQLIEAAGGYLNAFLDNAALLVEQQNLFLGTLQALTASIDAKDRYTCGHSERVAHLSARIARAMNMPEEEIDRVRIAGLVHDVGKIGVPEAVLCKQGKLTDEEFAAIKLHPEIGHRILHDIEPLADVLPGVLHHHERFDGKGYPHGLSGFGIPLFARIIALADTFDAMSSNRSYRAALPREKVLAEIERCAGTQFDPAVVDAFRRLDLAQYDSLVIKHAESERKAA